jgi:hypothetical protein
MAKRSHFRHAIVFSGSDQSAMNILSMTASMEIAFLGNWSTQALHSGVECAYITAKILVKRRKHDSHAHL